MEKRCHRVSLQKRFSMRSWKFQTHRSPTYSPPLLKAESMTIYFKATTDQSTQKKFWSSISGTTEHTALLTYLFNNAENK